MGPCTEIEPVKHIKIEGQLEIGKGAGKEDVMVNRRWKAKLKILCRDKLWFCLFII